MPETPEQLKARARALRNKKPDSQNKFGGDTNNRRGQKSEKPIEGAKSNFRKPSV